MAFRFFPEGRTFTTPRRRRPTQPIIRRPEPIPIPTPPRPTPRPGFRSQLNRTIDALRELQPAEAVEGLLGQQSELARFEHARAGLNARRLEAEALEAAAEKQRNQMDALRRGFAPSIDELEAHVKQAAAFRAGTNDRPYSEVLEEERLDEGSRRATEFSRNMEDLSPEQRIAFGPLSAGLLKEGMPGPLFQDIVESAQQEDGTVYQFQRRDRQKANRVLAAILETQGGGEPAFRGETPLIPEDQKDQAQALEEGRDTKAEADAALAVRDAERESQAVEEARRTRVLNELLEQYGDVEKIPQDVLRDSGLTQPTGPTEPIFSLSRDLNPATVGRFIKDLAAVPLEATDPIFEVEQEIFAPITEPVLREAFTLAHIPWADSLARLGSEVIVPSSAIPFARGAKGLKFGAKVKAAIPRAIQEGILNVQQNRAAKEVRDEPSPDIIEDLQMFGFGLITGGLGPEVLNGIGRVIEKARADPSLVRPAIDIAPTARGAPLEPAGVRQAPLKTGDRVALRSDPATPFGEIIAQSDRGVTIRPEGGGRGVLRARGRVQLFEDVGEVRTEVPEVEPARAVEPEAPVRAVERSPIARAQTDAVERGALIESDRIPEEVSLLTPDGTFLHHPSRNFHDAILQQLNVRDADAIDRLLNEGYVRVVRESETVVDLQVLNDEVLERALRRIEGEVGPNTRINFDIGQDPSLPIAEGVVPAPLRIGAISVNPRGKVVMQRGAAPEISQTVGEVRAHRARDLPDPELERARIAEPTVKASEAEATTARTKVTRAETNAKRSPNKKTKKVLEDAQGQRQSAEAKAEGARRRATPKKERPIRPVTEVVPEAPAPREAPVAGTEEFTTRSSTAADRLKAIIDDPTLPKSVRRDAQKLFDKVCK